MAIIGDLRPGGRDWPPSSPSGVLLSRAMGRNSFSALGRRFDPCRARHLVVTAGRGPSTAVPHAAASALMSAVVTTPGGAAPQTTASTARPTASVLVTCPGATRVSSGKTGRSTE